MESILEALGKKPTPPKAYDPQDTRSMAFFGQVIRNAFPSLSGTQRGKFFWNMSVPCSDNNFDHGSLAPVKKTSSNWQGICSKMKIFRVH